MARATFCLERGVQSVGRNLFDGRDIGEAMRAPLAHAVTRKKLRTVK
jgi:hypothetical protein